jgi:hypothetical protein
VPVPGADGSVVDVGTTTPTPDAGPVTNMSISSVTPTHGPFVGGTALTITGSGFTKNTKVRIGGRNIQVGEFALLSPTRIRVGTPAGEVGPADVEVSLNGVKVVKKNAYRYDAIYLDPNSGPIQGGTLVDIYGTGTAFGAGMKLTLGGKPLTNVEVIAGTKIRAWTPAGSAGLTDLAATDKNGKKWNVVEAFRYYVATNPNSGGLGGGTVKGTLTVSVLDWMTRKPLASAVVVIADSTGILHTGKTNATGVLVYTKTGLKGPLNVTAGLEKYESTTISSLDARDITIFLQPIIPPSMGPGPPPKMAGKVEGHIQFGGPTGIGSDKWEIVPEPKAGEIKRAYVYRTVPSIKVKTIPDTNYAAVVDYTKGTKKTAWAYSLAVAPGMMGVYALAGLYNKSADTFTPYALGVARGVVVGPGETKKNVDVLVDIPLKQDIKLTLKDVPATAVMHKVRLGIDLGAEGLILRTDNEKKGTNVPTSLTFSRMPLLGQRRGLVDAAYTVDAALDAGGTFDKPSLPFVRGTMKSVKPVNGELVMDKFIAGALLVDPSRGYTITGNKLTWKVNSVGKPSLALTLLVKFDLTPVWRIITNGTATSVTLPDPKTVGLTSWSNTTLIWAQWLIHLPSYDFNRYNYNHLRDFYWDRWSQEQSYFRTPSN